MMRSMLPRSMGVGLLLTVVLGAAPAARASLGMFPLPFMRPAPRDQSWLKDLPERPSRGKVAVFELNGDDVYQPMREAVVRVLRRRGLNVIVTLRPMEGATEHRETSQALNLAAFVSGEVIGEGARQAAVITLTSGLTGHRMASARFAGPTDKIVGDIGRTLWTRLGPAITRSCKSASRPRAREREPLRIDASDPLD
jgi:hypothetical protein